MPKAGQVQSLGTCPVMGALQLHTIIIAYKSHDMRHKYQGLGRSNMIYLLIAFGASLVGAISGLGGGVIIKPLLDLVGDYSASTIGLLSACTVLAMSTTALLRTMYAKTPIQLRLSVLLSTGAFAGGYLGNYLFDFALHSLVHTQAVTLLQNILLTALLIGVLVYMNRFGKKIGFHLQAPWIIFLVGLCLGTVSSFLGIGGGPINMVILTLFFSMKTKSATVHSLLLIFFSQGAKLATIALGSGFAGHDLTPLWLMIPAGMLGGLLGAAFHRKLSPKRIVTVFNATVTMIILIGLFNCVQAMSTLLI